MHANDVLRAGHEANVEAAEAICLLGARTNQQDHIVFHPPVAISPNWNGIVGDIDLAVGHLVLGHGALGDENALQFGGEVAGGVT